MSQPTPSDRAEKFLKEATQFRLGALVTESPHSRSRTLSQTARENIPQALEMLFDIDRDVLETYQRFVDSGRVEDIRDSVLNALSQGGKVFCTGCGSTGRLSIQLASIWRGFWQDMQEAGNAWAAKWEDRVFSVMAGGDFALIKAVEGFEDFTQFGRRQIRDLGLSAGDVVFAITEGGETSFVIGTAWEGADAGAEVFFVYNNPDKILCENVIRSREIIDEPRIEKINLTTGPMAITGSTRMQATTIQLCVMLTVFEMVIREIIAWETGKTADSDAVPAMLMNELKSVHSWLMSEPFLTELAEMVSLEESVYRAGKRNNYHARDLAVDVLTDTTERSPTYCVPAFKKFDDDKAAESWSFLFLPYETTEQAWDKLLKRSMKPVEWDFQTVRELIGPETADRQHEIISQIGRSEILKFKIGADGLKYRPLSEGDSAAAIVTDTDAGLLLQTDGVFYRHLKDASQAGAKTVCIAAGTHSLVETVRKHIQQNLPSTTVVGLEAPDTKLLLKPALRAGVKMMLNALSTCTMVRLGRVLGNVMIWVVPSNLKLIDRSCRYISQLADVSYEQACHTLFESVEYVTTRMQAGQVYPAPVGLSVMKLRHNLTLEQAEERLYAELSQ